ncbi:type II toxin-antitoxin system VapC family toxin [Herbiconiux moechotypicola]|uniref:Ribonuclease VapC n=1 Tax=Herbiconiux moechotypicola TaxID=637393 RepID=A0ABN3DM61_9MICO|nr:type II toxin-antitoxin system VapC family toxin [Herbiconiux moechotypicola]MCS5730211.1 type II toxin-antitoxin system VapC family toxin [Herbiconiux moechotypicola]
MIYADTNTLVYLVENFTPTGDAVRRRFAEWSADVAVSPLVELECKILPLRRGDDLLVRRYERLIEGLHMLDIPAEAFEQATRLRAHHRLSTLDAIHLATAQHHVCDAFWTHDDRLRAAAGGMAIETL